MLEQVLDDSLELGAVFPSIIGRKSKTLRAWATGNAGEDIEK